MGTISKALHLLTLFGEGRAEIGLAEFARLAKRDKATVHRHLTELMQNGFVEQNGRTRAYRLGPAVLRLAALREATVPMAKLLAPLVQDLAEAVGELVHASLLQAGDLSPLVHADPGRHRLHVLFDPAEVLPLHATASGLTVLAFLPEDRRAQVLARPLPEHTARTDTDPAELRQRLAQIRLDGHCTTDGTYDAEVASIAAPLFGPAGHILGAIAIAAPRARTTPKRLRLFARPLAAAAQEASGLLGYETDRVQSHPTASAPAPPGRLSQGALR